MLLKNKKYFFYAQRVWRAIYKTSFIVLPLCSLLFYIPLFPFLILYSIASRTKGDGFFLGVVDVANNLKYIHETLENSGIKSSMILFNNRLGNQYIIGNIKCYFELLILFLKQLRKSECFLFCWTYSFMPFNLDFLFLRLANKRTAVIHCGDDVRYRPLHNKLFSNEHFKFQFPLNEFDTPYIGFLRKLFRQKWPIFNNIKIMSCRETETFLSSDGVFQAFLIQKKAFFNIEKKSLTTPLIIHAPTSRSFKGTDVVMEAIEILKHKNVNFKFILLENVKNEEVLNLLSEALIVIDQPGYAAGRFAAEAFSYGCIVFNNENNLYTGFNRILPVKHFSLVADELAESLKKIITLPEEEIKIEIKSSFEAWNKYYSEENTLKRLLDIFYNSKKPDLFPLPNYKEKLIDGSENSFQRLMIKLFIK